MHAIVAPWTAHTRPSEEWAFYAVAALVAAQPPDARNDQTEQRRYLGLGQAVAVLQHHTRDGGSSARKDSTAVTVLEKRLHLLTRQTLPGLHRNLPPIVTRVRSKNIPLDWSRLLDDLARWPVFHDDISKRWLQQFYRDLPATAGGPVQPRISETEEE
jgi:CRISPR type I-E-associated protein CasB/Cse2